MDFLVRSGIDQIRLLGGEPTLHPDFPAMVDKVMDRGLRLLVFSNGLMPEPALRSLEEIQVERVAVLINVSDPAESPPGEQKQQFSVFRRLGARVIPGLNIHNPAAKFDFLLELIGKFGLAKRIRLGLAHPSLAGKNDFLHSRYYSNVGQRVVSFAKKAQAAAVDLDFDCGFVPCMFPMGGLDTLIKNNSEIGLRCNPILDVLPDGCVLSCYPLATVDRAPLPHNQDASWLRKYFEKKMKPWRSLGIFRECSACPIRKTGECVGGCLAAAMQRLRHTQSKFSLLTNDRIKPHRKKQVVFMKSLQIEPLEEAKSSRIESADKLWVVPYIDQPLSFWEHIAENFGDHIKEVYFPLPCGIIGSGRPVQPDEHLDEFLRHSPFAFSVLINPITLPRPAEEIAPNVIEAIGKMINKYDLAGVTVSNLILAARIRESFPELPLTASTLMEIAKPNQALMLNGICENLVPASSIMRLPGCPFRIQHFHEMGSNLHLPRSLCEELLEDYPWMRLTGAWVLPQHLHLYNGVYDELKIAGRVTLRNPADYLNVLKAYVNKKPLPPNKIGGGPASVLDPLHIDEDFFFHTLNCRRQCHGCNVCPDYYKQALKRYQHPENMAGQTFDVRSVAPEWADK
jgi:radical SAM protein with 4Fe4S-binding SPASM domain